jgi:hypothetical protein
VARCPRCAEEVSPTDQTCPHCGKGMAGRAALAVTPASHATDGSSRGKPGASPIAKVFYVIAAGGSVLGLVDLLNGIANATGAPQQAAAGAMGAAYAVIPYVFARAVDECTRS